MLKIASDAASAMMMLRSLNECTASELSPHLFFNRSIFCVSLQLDVGNADIDEEANIRVYS